MRGPLARAQIAYQPVSRRGLGLESTCYGRCDGLRQQILEIENERGAVPALHQMLLNGIGLFRTERPSVIGSQDPGLRVVLVAREGEDLPVESTFVFGALA